MIFGLVLGLGLFLWLFGVWLGRSMRGSSVDAVGDAMKQMESTIIKKAEAEKLTIDTAAQRDIAKIKIQTDEEIEDELNK